MIFLYFFFSLFSIQKPTKKDVLKGICECGPKQLNRVSIGIFMLVSFGIAGLSQVKLDVG